jgi:hypothetical protein
MKTFLLLLTIALGVTSCIAQSAPKQRVAQQQVGSTAEVATGADKSKDDPKVTVFVEQQNSAPKDAHSKDEPSDIAIQRANLHLTAWLVFVGFIQAVILAFTILAINRQTSANRNIERAWIMAELRCAPGTNLAQWNEPDGTTKTSIPIELYCINEGNSPAWITEKSARMVIISGELPKIPELARGDILGDADAVEPLAPGRDFKLDWIATGIGRHSIQTATLIYGMVKYRDIFEKDRETWFCYQFVGYRTQRKLIRVMAAPGYNKNT